MPDAEDAPMRPWQRRLVLALGFLVLVHSALLMLWLAPSSPIRDLIGTRNLASYVDPYFQQDVGAVDPSVQFVDETFQVRVALATSGDAKITPWVNLTNRDVDDVRYDPNPARVHLIARRLASNLNNAMFALEPAQRAIVRKTTAGDTTTVRSAALNQVGDNPASVQNYMAYDQMGTQFASLYAAARWPDDDILQVQFKVGRRTVPPFSKRDDKKLRDVDYLWFSFGWRPPFRGSADAQSAFDSYVKGG